MRFWIPTVIVTLLGITACIPGEPVTPSSRVEWESYSFSDPADGERLKVALAASGVRFATELKDGTEYIRWDGADAERANAIRIDLFGPDLPSGRNISFGGEMQERFKAWLAERSIPYSTVRKDGAEYIIWEQSADAAVRAYPYLPPMPK